MNADGLQDPPRNSLSDAKRRLIEQRLRGGRVPVTLPPPAARADADRRLASPSERWIFLAHQSSVTPESFNITSSFRVAGLLDLSLLERAINRVVARHEILRSSFQFTAPDVSVTVEEVAIGIQRLRCPSEADLVSTAEELARVPFDLSRAPLLRVHYLEADGRSGLLTLVVHDIIFDKWSLGVFWNETAAFYRESKHGDPVRLPVLPVQYRDVAASQHEWLTSTDCERQISYWRTKLANLQDPIPLPTDWPYPATLAHGGRLERWRVTPAVTARLKRLAATENASLFMLLLAAFDILLFRYTGATDIVVGSPVANRRGKDTAGAIGFFLSTVALRTKLNGDSTARGILQSVRETVLEALEHQDVPFDRMVAAVKPPRVSGRLPIFQVMFVYQREHEARPRFDLGDVELQHTYVETRTAKFDLTLFTAETSDGLETILEYKTDLFAPDTAHRILRHYERLLESIVSEADQPISHLALLPDEEEQLLFGRWQGPAVAVDERRTILDHIAAHLSDRPDAIAVSGAGRSMTYRQLDRAAASIAARLGRAGIKPGAAVAHFMDRTPESIAGILGILRCGAAYVPIDPSYPVERHRQVVADAGIEAAVTLRPLVERIRELVRHVVVADDAGAPGERSDSPVRLGLNDTAYIIYTSGSSGRPKGVSVSHRNLLYSTAARAHHYSEPPGHFVLVPSVAFDSSVAVIFWTLASGGTLVVADADEVRDPARLAALIRDHRVSDLLCIPALYRELLRQTTIDLRSLTRVIVAGESCSPSLVAAHYERLPAAALFNEYGPTEVTVWATVHACTGADAEGASVPIGRPIANSSAFVLTPELQPAPIGIAGELFLGGQGVVQGYHGQAKRTEERFVTCRLPIAGPVRLYRSGDLVRWRADGALEYLGRDDGQIKVRGYRIEPGEIEAVLEQHPAVRRAAVVATRSAPRDSQDGRDELSRLAAAAATDTVESLLADVEALSPDAVEIALRGEVTANRRPERIAERGRFRLELHTTVPGFVAPPRDAQRNWVLTKAMEEFADDLEHLDVVSRSFVPGFPHRLARDLQDITHAALTDQQIMEDWQIPLMRAMARHVTESHGDVLEIGFGRGVAAEFIQQFHVRSHTIVESNDHSVRLHFEPWRRRHAKEDIRLWHARWQDVADQLGRFDGIFFHAFPTNEQEFTDYVLRSVTFAEHAFAAMAARLVDGGVFTYLTTEIDSLGRGHQRSLFKHFRTVSMHVETLDVPETTHDTWWSNSMVVVKAVK
jgi:amino acid adenylation domain-containing protein